MMMVIKVKIGVNEENKRKKIHRENFRRFTTDHTIDKLDDEKDDFKLQ